MEEETLKNVLAQQRKAYHQLNSVLDLTQQLAEAVTRDDQVSMRMLLAMRREPIMQLGDIQSRTQALIQSSPPDTAMRLDALYQGGAAETELEKPLCTQLEQNHRLLDRIIQLDKVVNRKLAGPKSFYGT